MALVDEWRDDPYPDWEKCRHCQQPIERCPHVITPELLCKGWRHVGYEDQPWGRHHCEARIIRPIAEPAAPSAGDTPTEGGAGE